MSYTRVVASLKELFGRSPKTKTPVTAGVHVNPAEEKEEMFTGDSGDGNGSRFDPKGKTPFSKLLRWKLKTREIVTRVKVTKAMAQEMLKFNDRNRPVRQGLVNEYARQIIAGLWAYTREPIIFSDKNRLIDGQHRLLAVVETGIPIIVDIAFGAPDSSFAYIDVGGKRTAGDIFAINGVQNHGMAAAATRFIMSYEAGKTNSDNVGGLVQANLEETYRKYLTLEGLQNSIKVGQKFARDRLPVPSTAAALHYLCAQKNRQLADEYFEKIASGIGFTSRNEPAKKIRDFLTRDGTRIRARSAAAAIIAGWNAMRTNKKLGDVSKIDRVGRIV